MGKRISVDTFLGTYYKHGLMQAVHVWPLLKLTFLYMWIQFPRWPQLFDFDIKKIVPNGKMDDGY